MRLEIQIWSQNCNQIIFDPFWLKNSRKLGKFYFVSFWPFLGQRGGGGGKRYPISYANYEARLGILSSRCILWMPKWKWLKSFFYPPHCNVKTLVARGRVGMKILLKWNMRICFQRCRARENHTNTSHRGMWYSWYTLLCTVQSSTGRPRPRVVW